MESGVTDSNIAQEQAQVDSGLESENGRPRPNPEVIRQILDGAVCAFAQTCPSIRVNRHIYDDEVHSAWTRQPQAFTFEAKILATSNPTMWTLRVNDSARDARLERMQGSKEGVIARIYLSGVTNEAEKVSCYKAPGMLHELNRL
jgi:hypothetical protein